MGRLRWAILAFGLGMLLPFNAAIGLARRSKAVESGKWMLEFASANRAPQYVHLPEGQNKNQADQFDVNLAVDQTRGPGRPSILDFRYWMQGNAVRVGVSLIFDLSGEHAGAPKELRVGNFIVHPGESVSVSKLRRFGLQPVRMTIVTAVPPDAMQPEIINETSSVMVENVNQDRAGYKLVVHNTSDLAVHAIVLSIFDGAGRCMMHSPSALFGPLIAPAETAEISLAFPIPPEETGVIGPKGLSCSYLPQAVDRSSENAASGSGGIPKIVIEAVDFQDGSYEGNAQKAAMLEAVRLARKIERSQITKLVEDQLASSQPDGLVQLESVQSQVRALPDNVDSAAVNVIISRFPSLPEGSRKPIEKDMREGLLLEKGEFERNLQIYLAEGSKSTTVKPSLRRWWDVTRGRCDFLALQACPGPK